MQTIKTLQTWRNKYFHDTAYKPYKELSCLKQLSKNSKNSLSSFELIHKLGMGKCLKNNK